MAADITPFIKDAQKLEKETGIPASITLGQIILESSGRYSGGLSGLATSGKNLFGVKGTGNAGSVLMPTSEVYNGKTVTVQAQFRKYNSFYDSMLDHAKVLSLPRYQTHLKDATTVNQFAAGIKAGGYATDPNYVSKLLGVIQSNGLAKYDTGDKKYTPVASGGTDNATTTPIKGGAETTKENNIVENIFFHSLRSIIILGLVVLMVVFFLKAFPAVEDAASVIPAGKVINTVKKVAKK